MAGRKRMRRATGVGATDLAQMGVCERLVKFEHDCGRRRTVDQLQSMRRGRRAHERFYRARFDDGPIKGRCFVASLLLGEARETRVLRLFRDRVLRPRPFGRRLVVVYYRCASAVCRMLERRPELRQVMHRVLRQFASLAARWLEWHERREHHHVE